MPGATRLTTPARSGFVRASRPADLNFSRVDRDLAPIPDNGERAGRRLAIHRRIPVPFFRSNFPP
jgi:hypothetical protein